MRRRRPLGTTADVQARLGEWSLGALHLRAIMKAPAAGRGQRVLFRAAGSWHRCQCGAIRSVQLDGWMAGQCEGSGWLLVVLKQKRQMQKSTGKETVRDPRRIPICLVFVMVVVMVYLFATEATNKAPGAKKDTDLLPYRNLLLFVPQALMGTDAQPSVGWGTGACCSHNLLRPISA